MGKRQLPPEEPAEIHEVMLRDALEERYLAYALSTIMHRALPDARDGLKPVHRRILYGMRLLRLDPGTPFKKSAKIVGDVMGSFHPHGDQAIYDAMVRLAQDFASRYPLVDGQGNFGNIDGDNPAAYRYTEARMTDVARLLLEGIDEDGVEFRPNYDGQSKEPVVLPGGFPNLLANGSQGIAVGMATSIPPHNAAELCDAALHLIDKPDAKSKSLLKWVKGPDFPTGGIIVDSKESIAEAYMTGRGSFRTRAKWTQEEGARGTWVVVITEIPWLVQKSRLVEKIAELLNEKKLPLVGDVRDESAEDVRLVIEPKSRAVDPALMMESLFRLTELESKISLNLNVLIKGKIPKVVGLAECLREWLDHLRDVLVRRSNFRKTQIENRLEILGGYLIAYLEHRQGDQDHPHRGRAEAGADQGVQADGSPGRRHPQHAPALLAQARGIRNPHRGQEPSRRVEGPQGAARLPRPSNGPRSASRSARSATFLGRRRRSASAARCSPTRPSTISPRSRKPLSSASRARW
jgi:topoisomerase-4 subunit A